MNQHPTTEVVRRTFRTWIGEDGIYAAVTGAVPQDPHAGKIKSDKWNLPFLASSTDCSGCARAGGAALGTYLLFALASTTNFHAKFDTFSISIRSFL